MALSLSVIECNCNLTDLFGWSATNKYNRETNNCREIVALEVAYVIIIAGSFTENDNGKTTN